MSFTLPDLANVYDDDASELSRKFGPGITNYFSGSPLNRLSFLRHDPTFLTAAFSSPQAQFVVLNDFAPLVQDVAQLRCLALGDISPLTGTEPFKLSEEEAGKSYDSTAPAQPVLIFLGLWEEAEANGKEENGDGYAEQFQYRGFKGRPWFAVDITPRGPYSEAAQSLITRLETKGPDDEGKTGSFFLQGTRQNSLNALHAAIYGQARAMIDWNTRNRFCASCGLPTLSVHAGYKRICPATDLSSSSSPPPPDTPTPRRPCPSRSTISNIAFPRSDPTMIAAVLSHDGSRLLLGRQRRWPPRLYSVLAGFLEPGESVEEAVRREVFEEAGVRVGRVVLHSTQPWPYPASLMIGAVASALPGEGEAIHTGHDDELEDARWVAVEEVREALGRVRLRLGDTKPNGLGGGDDGEGDGEGDGGKILLPPWTAIANRLLTAVIEGFGRV